MIGQHRPGRQRRHVHRGVGARFADGDQLAGVGIVALIVREQRRQRFLHDRRLLGAEGPAEQAPGHEVDATFGRDGLLERELGERAGRLDELRVVQRDQRLQRRVGALAADRAELAVRGVEDVERCRRRRPLPERVHAAAIKGLARIALVVARVAADDGHRLPDPFRLVWLDAGAADLGREQAARGQSVVADHLGIEPVARAAREQPILRVLLQRYLRDHGRLAVGGGGHQHLEEALDVPALLAEFDGQPVEQLGVAGQIAGDAEVAAAADQAVAEKLLPEPVDRDPRRQGMLRAQQPLRETEAVVRQIGGHGWQGFRRAGLHLVAALSSLRSFIT